MSEMTPVLSAYWSISSPISLARDSHMLEFRVPLLHLMNRPCLKIRIMEILIYFLILLLWERQDDVLAARPG